jgi:hypothetical protein
MGLVPVNPLKVTSVVGLGPEIDSEFLVTRLSMGGPNRIKMSPDDRDSKGHRGNLDIAREC